MGWGEGGEGRGEKRVREEGPFFFSNASNGRRGRGGSKGASRPRDRASKRALDLDRRILAPERTSRGRVDARRRAVDAPEERDAAEPRVRAARLVYVSRGPRVRVRLAALLLVLLAPGHGDRADAGGGLMTAHGALRALAIGKTRARKCARDRATSSQKKSRVQRKTHSCWRWRRLR